MRTLITNLTVYIICPLLVGTLLILIEKAINNKLK